MGLRHLRLQEERLPSDNEAGQQAVQQRGEHREANVHR